MYDGVDGTVLKPSLPITSHSTSITKAATRPTDCLGLGSSTQRSYDSLVVRFFIRRPPDQTTERTRPPARTVRQQDRPARLPTGPPRQLRQPTPYNHRHPTTRRGNLHLARNVTKRGLVSLFIYLFNYEFTIIELNDKI